MGFSSRKYFFTAVSVRITPSFFLKNSLDTDPINISGSNTLKKPESTELIRCFSIFSPTLANM